MLTSGELNYLHSQDIPVRVRQTSAGKIVIGGDAQYTPYLIDPNAAANFKSYVKDEIGRKVDETLKAKYPRATNQRYRAKHMEALSYKNTGYTGSSDDYQYLKQEALERGITMTQMADLIISATNNYNSNVAAVEKRRIKFNSDVDSSTTLEDINALWVAAESAIEGL